MNLENLGKLNKLYNFQDTIILCKIFEQRSHHLSGCVHRNKTKCLIALHTDAEQVKIFERTLIGGFSCVNIRLAFDSQILSPKN